jgi:hypothetical protein
MDCSPDQAGKQGPAEVAQQIAVRLAAFAYLSWPSVQLRPICYPSSSKRSTWPLPGSCPWLEM